MKKTLLAVLALASSALARDASDKTKQALLDIEQQVGRANLGCDYDFFRKIEAEEFFFTGPSGKITTRAEDLAGEKDCKKHEGTYSLSEERVMLYGDTAVVSAVGTYETANAKGERVRHSSRFTDVFVRRNGAWVMVAGHSSTIKEPLPTN